MTRQLTTIVESEHTYPMIPTNTTDAAFIEMWLHGRSPRTQTAYRADITKLLDFTRKGIRALTLPDLQTFSDSLAHLEDTSRARILSAVKSLLTFAYKTGYLPVNVGAALRLPKLKEKLAERIMSESAVHKMLALETNARNHAMIRLMYGAGLRVSELCSLTWQDAQERGEAGQVTIFGKGGKTRHVLLSQETYAELAALRLNAAPDTAPVFTSRGGGNHRAGAPLDASQVNRIVHAAARRAGVPGEVSPHWLRHAHASHALDKGAPVSLVRDTLGHASIATTNKYSHVRPGASSATFLSV